MPLYFFHIRRNGDRVEDEEGVELPDLNAARSEASSSVRDLVGSGIPMDTSDAIEITDRDRQVLAFLTIGEVLARDGKG